VSNDQTFYGWYDDPSQPIDKPSYNPPFDAPCPYCGKPISENDIRTHSLMYIDGAQAVGDELISVQRAYGARSYFYRTHRTCDETHGPGAMDGFLLDMVKRNGD